MAQQLGAGTIVDPRPYAKGSLKKTFAKFPHLENVLPAMGYGDEQIHDLEETIKATPCDTIILGTPSNITNVFDVEKPFVGAKYELEMHQEHEEQFHNILDSFYNRFICHHVDDHFGDNDHQHAA